VDFQLPIYSDTGIFGVDEQTWYRHGVFHALLYGGGVGGVEDEVNEGGEGMVEERECWMRGGEERCDVLRRDVLFCEIESKGLSSDADRLEQWLVRIEKRFVMRFNSQSGSLLQGWLVA
jgi:hypothetical protein